MRIAAVRQCLGRGAGCNVEECEFESYRANMLQDVVETIWFDVLQHVGANNEIRGLRFRILARYGRVVLTNVQLLQSGGELAFATSIVENAAAAGLADK